MQSQKRNIAEGTADPWVEIFHQSNILANRMPEFPAPAIDGSYFQRENFSGQVPTESLRTQDSENVYERWVQQMFDPVLVGRSWVSDDILYLAKSTCIGERR